MDGHAAAQNAAGRGVPGDTGRDDGDGDLALGGARLGSTVLTKGKNDLPLAPEMQDQTRVRGRADERGAASRVNTALARIGNQRGLLLVGLFKLSKAVFFTAVGAGALHLVNRNIRSVLLHAVDVLRIDPERHFVSVLLDHVGFIDPHELRKAGILSFLYAMVCVVEGTGLVLERRWAEYFTVILTALGLPWEGFELLVRFAAYKLVLLVINFGVLVYLLWILKKRRDESHGGAAATI